MQVSAKFGQDGRTKTSESLWNSPPDKGDWDVKISEEKAGELSKNTLNWCGNICGRRVAISVSSVIMELILQQVLKIASLN